MKFDPYKVLGVKRTAQGPELRAAKRRLQKQYHPDKPGGSHEKMADINRAYDILIDPDARKRFDETGEFDQKTMSIEEIAMQGIRMNLAKLLDDESIDLEHIDLIGTMRASAERARNKLLDHMPSILKKIERLEKSRKRMKSEALLGMYDQMIEGLREHYHMHEKEVPMMDATIELLSGFKYEYDRIPGRDALHRNQPHDMSLEKLFSMTPEELLKAFQQ